MEEKRSNSAGGVGGMALFALIGFVGALVVGWGIFPKMLYSQKTQPIRFSHTVHTQLGIECEQCHHLGPDGRFAGPQRALYELVLASQQAAIAARPSH